MSRRAATILLALLAVCAFSTGGSAIDPIEEITPACERAVERGLAFLAGTQDADGAWKDLIGRKETNTYKGHYDKFVGSTALAVMAFMSYGHFPGRGRYGRNVHRGLSWLCDHVDAKGYVSYSESRMYSHAFATLALAEAYGMSHRADLGEKVRKAVKLICVSQNKQGAWRYKPGAPDSDISITVCQVMALRAARNSGIYVDKGVIDRAIEYVKLSYTNDGYMYQVFETHTRRSVALTAAGVVALQGAGEYDAKETISGIKYLFRSRGTGQISARRMRQSFDYFYAHYYAVQAMFQAGGKEWSVWYPQVRDDLIRGQFSDGRWHDLVGPNYATSMAVVILLIPYRYLPIFER
jgi:hypothetical protein